MSAIERTRVLIVVKTYPTLSKTYGETVCTAGIDEVGRWVRLYPIPFRRLEDVEKYRKYQWVECDVVKRPANKDRRPESFAPVGALKLGEFISADHRWRDRRAALAGVEVFTDLTLLLDGAKKNRTTLALFKPARIVNVLAEKEEQPAWTRAEIDRIGKGQLSLLEPNDWRDVFQVVKKLPYRFKYVFEDVQGRASTLSIIDWEIGALYWNCLRNSSDERSAVDKVKQKYLIDFGKTDLHFFLGTVLRHQGRAPNPWQIIGVMPLPVEHQLPLL